MSTKISRIACIASLMVATGSFAAGMKTYQVTGPGLEVTDTKITVQKGSEKWELAVDPSTKKNGDVKVGSKVTIEYTMSATTVTSKDATKKADKK